MPARRFDPGLLLGGRCGGCGDALAPRVLAAGGSWCEHCRVRWGPVAGFWPEVAHGANGWAAASYAGPVRRAVLAAKRGAPGAAGEVLAARAAQLTLPAQATVTWVPAHPQRAWLTPDAGHALAAVVADLHRLPLRPLLQRRPWGRRQAGRAAEARRSNPSRLGLTARGQHAGPVVLVDDVRTTGATLDHAARLLRAAGASEVFAIVVALATEERAGVVAGL